MTLFFVLLFGSFNRVSIIRWKLIKAVDFSSLIWNSRNPWNPLSFPFNKTQAFISGLPIDLQKIKWQWEKEGMEVVWKTSITHSVLIFHLLKVFHVSDRLESKTFTCSLPYHTSPSNLLGRPYFALRRAIGIGAELDGRWWGRDEANRNTPLTENELRFHTAQPQPPSSHNTTIYTILDFYSWHFRFATRNRIQCKWGMRAIANRMPYRLCFDSGMLFFGVRNSTRLWFCEYCFRISLHPYVVQLGVPEHLAGEPITRPQHIINVPHTIPYDKNGNFAHCVLHQNQPFAMWCHARWIGAVDIGRKRRSSLDLFYISNDLIEAWARWWLPSPHVCSDCNLNSNLRRVSHVRAVSCSFQCRHRIKTFVRIPQIVDAKISKFFLDFTSVRCCCNNRVIICR